VKAGGYVVAWSAAWGLMGTKARAVEEMSGRRQVIATEEKCMQCTQCEVQVCYYSLMRMAVK